MNNIKLDSEMIKGFGKIGLKIGKSIVVEGTKAVVLKGTAAVITQSFEEGFGAVKDLSMDDLLNGRKIAKKKSIFKKKKEIYIEEAVEPEVTE